MPEIGSADTIEIVNGALTFVTGALVTGMAVFPVLAFPLGIMAGVGGFVSSILMFFTSKEDPVAKKLRELAEKFRELDKKITDGFNEMKLFLAESKFTMTIIDEVGILKKFLYDVFTELTQESLDNFRAAYKQNSPLDIAYTLLFLLLQKSTNPLMLSLAKDRLEREAAFRAWNTIVLTILWELRVLEAIACGLLYDMNTHDFERLTELSKDISAILDDWDEKYQTASWNEFKNELPALIKKNWAMNHSRKADEIRMMLEKTCSQYAFYICVFNVDGPRQDYYCHCLNQDEIIEVKNVGLCNAFVYRSRRALKMKEKHFENTKRDVEACGEVYLFRDKKSEELLKKEFLEKKRVRDDGMVALVKGAQTVIQFANCPGHQKGPGWWETLHQGEHAIAANYIRLIVGLP
uniref:DUF1978 domain-containing protein n=1 Tax=Caenorhabditis tropicalis TaxID=1561998 RepID=A0A1I7TVT6_9PELO